MADYPRAIVGLNHIEPVPRRIRAVHGDRVVVDSLQARYVWEWAYYPQYYVPRNDVDEGLLVSDGRLEETPQGTVQWFWMTESEVGGPPACASGDQF